VSTKEVKEEIEEGEFFPTPREVVYALLDSPLVDLPGGRWIEPCAGTGRIISAVNDVRSDIQWDICELNTTYSHSETSFTGRGSIPKPRF